MRDGRGGQLPDAKLQVEHELVVLVALGDGLSLPPRASRPAAGVGPRRRRRRRQPPTIAGVLHPHRRGAPPRRRRGPRPPPAWPSHLLSAMPHVLSPSRPAAPAKPDLFIVSLSSPAPPGSFAPPRRRARAPARCPPRRAVCSPGFVSRPRAATAATHVILF